MRQRSAMASAMPQTSATAAMAAKMIAVGEMESPPVGASRGGCGGDGGAVHVIAGTEATVRPNALEAAAAVPSEADRSAATAATVVSRGTRTRAVTRYDDSIGS